jgi:hypothetical protein
VPLLLPSPPALAPLTGLSVVVELPPASLTCLWECRSQGGCARRPHPHALRGAPAAAPEVLALLPPSLARPIPTDFGASRAHLLIPWFFVFSVAPAPTSRRSSGGTRVCCSRSAPEFHFTYAYLCASLPVSLCARVGVVHTRVPEFPQHIYGPSIASLAVSSM